MKNFNTGYLFVFITITFTVFGQLLVKAGMSKVAASLEHSSRWSSVITAGFLQPAVLAGLACAVIAALAWFPALMRLPISIAYPFMALPIVLVLLLAPLVFGERVTLYQWIGVFVVSFGLWLGAR